MALALRTGIAPSVWAEEGEQAVVTAIHLLDTEGADRTDGAGRQTSG